ncbi:MAG: hypothetical protein M1587_08945 [Thaumarchaeota archaeon]|nr:hypothetical protein [Nitrososphaerota archaeon]
MNEKAEVKTDSGDDYRNVMQAVRDFIFDKHRFPQVNDIVDSTGIQKLRCNEVIDQLIRQKQLYVAFEGEGLPRIILLYDMMQGVLMTQKKPDWLVNYGFSQRSAIAEQIEKLQKEAIQYEQFERLLYAADIPLEEAIAYALEWLGFEDVIHHKDDSDNPDVTFQYDGIKALLEAEGTTKAGPKDKVGQLSTWMQRELTSGAQASKLAGFFAVNHFRDLDPGQRGDPLTPHAKEFLRAFHYSYFTTTFLFQIVKQVSTNKLSREDARKKIWEGEKTE